jgi:hypothetical protein
LSIPVDETATLQVIQFMLSQTRTLAAITLKDKTTQQMNCHKQEGRKSRQSKITETMPF